MLYFTNSSRILLLISCLIQFCSSWNSRGFVQRTQITDISKYRAFFVRYGSRQFEAHNVESQQDSIYDVEKFNHIENKDDVVSHIIGLAIKRHHLSEVEKLELFDNAMDKLLHVDSEKFALFIWSTGILKFNTILSKTKQSENSSSRRDKFKRIISSITLSNISKRSLFSLMIGFGKLHIKWNDLPVLLQNQYLELSSPNADINSNGSSLLSAREVSSYFYTLGQLEFNRQGFPSVEFETSLMNRLQVTLNEMTMQGISNSFHGMSKLGYNTTSLSDAIFQKLESAIVPLSYSEIKTFELTSLIQSLAVMKINWQDIPSRLRMKLISCVKYCLSKFNSREVSNVIWSMGKLNCKSSDSTVSILVHSLLDQLNSSNNFTIMSEFDLESIFVGLGLLDFEFLSFTPETRVHLLSLVNKYVERMNIFCMHNVLWGMARMKCHIKHQDPQLSSKLLNRTVDILHTFLPSHFSDVFWAFGTLGIVREDMESEVQDRLLAIVSRIFFKLNNREAVFTLWGLSKMGFSWLSISHPTKSLPNGNQVSPLSIIVTKYLRQKLYSMREFEYSVLWYALGEMNANIYDFEDLIIEKLSKRILGVSNSIESRSVSNSLHGMAKCGVVWQKLPQESRSAWVAALLDIPYNTSVIYNNDGKQRGIPQMNPLEVSQTVFALGLMNATWSEFPEILQNVITSQVNDLYSKMTHFGRSSCLWGLAFMSCPRLNIPNDFVNLVINDLLSSVESSQVELKAIDEYPADGCIERQQRFASSMNALSKLEINLDPNIRSTIENYFCESATI